MNRLGSMLIASMIAGLAALTSAGSDAPKPTAPSISARPTFVRIPGFLVAVDEARGEIAIRDYRTVRRAFKVEGSARHALSGLSPGNAVILTCRKSERGPTVVQVEVEPI